MPPRLPGDRTGGASHRGDRCAGASTADEYNGRITDRLRVQYPPVFGPIRPGNVGGRWQIVVMSNPLPHLSSDLDAVHAAWSRATGSAAIDGADSTALRSIGDAELLALTDALGRLIRDGQAALARAAAEVADRSPSELGKDGLAKQQGFLNPAHLVAAATGGRVAGAAQLIAVGVATSDRQALTGEPLPPTNPHVAAALASGAISIDAAGAITSMLSRVEPRANAADADRMEQTLAAKAAELPFDLLLRVIREAEARLDQDGIAPREEELRADRMLSLRQDGHGMVHGRFTLDPETAAPVKAAIEAIVTHEIRAARSGDDDGSVVADSRTIPQMQADALAMIARHVLGCSRVPSAPAMSLVVRTELAALTEGLGFGQIDGIDHPVSAGTIRKMAASSGIIPTVLGTESLPLDLGRTARLFSPAQRIALAERDGGCACCGLGVAYAEAHHIQWWKRDTGPTDLSNGVMLCPPCHTRVHEDGWIIRVDRGGDVWFVPPPHVDSARTPRLGGKARFGLGVLQPAG